VVVWPVQVHFDRFSVATASSVHFLADIVKFSAFLVIFNLVPCFLGGLVCFLASSMVFQPVLWYFWLVLLASLPVWWYFSLKTNLQCCLQSLCQ
jgi:hypothetical protein